MCTTFHSFCCLFHAESSCLSNREKSSVLLGTLAAVHSTYIYIYIYIYICLSGFDKRYLQKLLAKVSFEPCTVLDHSFFFNDLFSTKVSLKAAIDQKIDHVFNMLFTSSPPPPPAPLQLSPTYHYP